MPAPAHHFFNKAGPMISMRTINGKSVNPVGLGCMNLHWSYGMPPTPEAAAQLLHRALELGYNHLDTARIYGLGKNEALIGATLKGRRNAFFLASKTGLFADGDRRRVDCSPGAIRSSCDESLRQLQTDHIDLYYLHRRDFNVPIEESMGALADLVRAGKIGAIGLSEMSADTLRRASTVHPVAAMQSEYSLWTRNVEIAVLDACRALGTTLVAFSPVARGVLANGVTDPDLLAPKDMRCSMPRFTAEHWPHNSRLVADFNALAAEAGVTPAQLSLAWVLSRGPHVVAIPGTARLDHLEENFARWSWLPPTELLSRLDALINQQTVSGPRYGPAMQSTIDTEDF